MGMWADIGEGVMSAFGLDEGSSMGSNIGKGVGGAMKMLMGGAMGGGKAHSNVQAQAFHYQSNANPITALKTGFDYMKNDINVGSGLNDVKNLF